MESVNEFKVTFNEDITISVTSTGELSHEELRKQAFVALLTDLVWTQQTDPPAGSSTNKEETWCWLLTQMGLALTNASRLDLDHMQEPLKAVGSAAEWFLKYRSEMVKRMHEEEDA